MQRQVSRSGRLLLIKTMGLISVLHHYKLG